MFETLLKSARILPGGLVQHKTASYSEPMIDIFKTHDHIVQIVSKLEKMLLMVLEVSRLL